jgi:DNA replication and repair protein RecF
MLLESIEADGFRNLRGRIELSGGLSILAGDNGAGKTNWLEAIAVLADARSFRTPRLAEVVAFGSETGSVSGSVRESPEIVRELRVIISDNKRTLWVNGSREPRAEYVRHLTAVVFSADRLEIVRGQPEARRRFLDEGIIALHPPFVRVFSDYERVLKQKNALLQSARDGADTPDKTAERLAPWNEQLAALGTRIHRARSRLVDRLNEVLETHLFGPEDLTLRYLSSLEDKGDLTDYEELMNERLRLRVQAEMAAGRGLIGPHRDDLELKLAGHDVRRFGSAGQQRSVLLLIVLAKIALFHATRGEYPLFLIDDIDAELDYRRIGRLLEFLEGKTQTIVTTSKESFIERFGPLATVYEVASGHAKPN